MEAESLRLGRQDLSDGESGILTSPCDFDTFSQLIRHARYL